MPLLTQSGNKLYMLSVKPYKKSRLGVKREKMLQCVSNRCIKVYFSERNIWGYRHFKFELTERFFSNLFKVNNLLVSHKAIWSLFLKLLYRIVNIITIYKVSFCNKLQAFFQTVVFVWPFASRVKDRIIIWSLSLSFSFAFY